VHVGPHEHFVSGGNVTRNATRPLRKSDVPETRFRMKRFRLEAQTAHAGVDPFGSCYFFLGVEELLDEVSLGFDSDLAESDDDFSLPEDELLESAAAAFL